MAENSASEKADEKDILKLVETLKEKNERIEQLLEEKGQLAKVLNAKDVLNKTLQNALLAEKTLVKFLKQKMKEWETSENDGEKNKSEGDAENGSDNVRKNVKEERDQIDQPKNSSSSDSDSDSSIDSAVPMEAAVKVARIPMIVIHLLKCIKNRDLLQNCRLVSREWRDWSTEILLERKTFQVCFRRHEIYKVFTARYSKLYKIWDLTQFTAFLTTSKTFPCAYFVFDGNLKSEEAQEFLTKFASRVKGIKLIGPQNLNFVRKLLVEQIPHVESLKLKGFVEEENFTANPNRNRRLPQNPPAPAPQIPVPTKIFPEIFQYSPVRVPVPAPQLSSLTFLKLGTGNSPEWIQEILDAAPNLQECFGIGSAEEIECLRQSHRLHILKGLKLKPGKDILKTSPSRVENIFPLMKILQENSPADPLYKQLHLTDLQFNYSEFLLYYNFTCETRAHFCSILSKLLATSQTTLKQVKYGHSSIVEGLIEWPRLEKIEKLTLERDLTRGLTRLFPPAEVPQIFPNLHTLQLKDFHRITDEQLRILKNIPRILTVKNLFLGGAHVEMIQGFARLLPNVTHLSIKPPHGPFYSEPFSKWAPIIWQTMRGLKSLQVEFDCPAAEIDAGFTGMEIETCKVIRTLGGDQDGFQMEEIDKFRTSSSILNLTELEALFLPDGFAVDENPKYDHGENFRGDAENKKATFISFKYAFKLMPKLRVFPRADN